MTDGVLEMRLVVTAEDYEAAVAFYRDTLGLPEQAAFEGAGDARVVILDAGRATLKLANTGAAARDRAPWRSVATSARRIRLAFEVTDAAAATAALDWAWPARRSSPSPSKTPWRSLNSRLGRTGQACS